MDSLPGLLLASMSIFSGVWKIEPTALRSLLAGFNVSSFEYNNSDGEVGPEDAEFVRVTIACSSDGF
jgi:hypothetical protein